MMIILVAELFKVTLIVFFLSAHVYLEKVDYIYKKKNKIEITVTLSTRR